MHGIHNFIIYLKQTIFLGYVVLQLFCSYSSVIVGVGGIGVGVFKVYRSLTKQFLFIILLKTWHVLSITAFCMRIYRPGCRLYRLHSIAISLLALLLGPHISGASQ